MTEAELLQRLSGLVSSQLDLIPGLVGLDRRFLPNSGPPAARADAILQLVAQRGAKGLKALEKAIEEVTDPADRTLTIRKGKKIARPQRKVTKCVLVLAANPMDTERLRIEPELKAIKQELRTGKAGGGYRVEMELASSRDELSKHLIDYEPVIVHFSGHGTPAGEIILEGENGQGQPVRPEALSALFGALKGTEIVVLNSCYSDRQAAALAQVVPYVVGMSRDIGDGAALRFAQGFYRALGGGKDYKVAFELGCAQIQLDLAQLPDAVVPRFTTRGQVRLAGHAAIGATGDSVSTAAPVAAARRVTRSGGPKAAAPQDEAASRLYPLWYGTNRRPNDPNDPARGFSGERDGTKTHYGTCKVLVPKSHKIGSAGSSWWKRFLAMEDDRLKLEQLVRLAEQDFWRGARDALAEWQPDERRALVFIHGYNVTFEEAALRAAQLGVDLKVPGITAFYSWPSKGGLAGYPADEATIEASEAQITDFLTRFAGESGATRVDVLAHSMGNRGLLRALQRILHKAADAGRAPFGQLMLAAPDIDADVFKDLAIAYPRLAQRTTLYVSAKDKALAVSGIVHDYPRAGYTPPVMVIPGIDTVEVTNIDLTFLGHGYFAAARDLLHDIHNLIMHGEPPEKRLGLQRARTRAGGHYWQIGA